jgi:hypothetical protein
VQHGDALCEPWTPRRRAVCLDAELGPEVHFQRGLEALSSLDNPNIGIASEEVGDGLSAESDCSDNHCRQGRSASRRRPSGIRMESSTVHRPHHVVGCGNYDILCLVEARSRASRVAVVHKQWGGCHKLWRKWPGKRVEPARTVVLGE